MILQYLLSIYLALFDHLSCEALIQINLSDAVVPYRLLNRVYRPAYIGFGISR